MDLHLIPIKNKLPLICFHIQAMFNVNLVTHSKNGPTGSSIPTLRFKTLSNDKNR